MEEGERPGAEGGAALPERGEKEVGVEDREAGAGTDSRSDTG